MIMTTASIKPEYVDLAKYVKDEIDNQLSKDHEVFSHPNAFIGFVGQYVVRDYLMLNGIKVVADVPVGHADVGDVIVGNTIIDIKTHVMNSFKQVLCPEQDHFSDIYLFVEVNEECTQYEILGWCTKKVVKGLKPRMKGKMIYPARFISKSKLRPIEFLVEYLQYVGGNA